MYDSRIRPSGINGTGRETSFGFQQRNWKRNKISLLPDSQFHFNFGHFLDGATFVYVNVFVRSFSAINDVKMVSLLSVKENVIWSWIEMAKM